jgi:hypothetical protein
MKTAKYLTATALTISMISAPLLGLAAEEKKTDKAKPYTLKTCVVSDEKLGEMGKPYVFTNDTREIKLCCKDCLKDFKKDPKKYVKKIEEAEAKEKKK